MIQDELAKKEMEKHLNVRNVERSLLERVVDDANEVIGIFDTQNISEIRSIYPLTLKHIIITLFQYWFFFENQSKFTSLYSITDRWVCCASVMKILYRNIHCQWCAAKIKLITVWWSKIWPKLNAKMKACVFSKEYASSLCDLFFYLIVLKGCYLNIKRSYAQTPIRRTYGRFFNEHWHGKLLCSEHRVFFGKYSQGKLFVHSMGQLSLHKLQHTCRLHHL